MVGNRDYFEDAEDDVGLSQEKVNLGPRKKPLVRSPNGLLIHRANLANKSSIPNAHTPDAHYGSHSGNIYDKNKKIVCYDHSGLEEDAEDYGGLSLMKLNLGPRKKLVIFGLGGLLCHRVCHKQRSSVPIYRSPDAANGSYIVYKRPYCTDFMKFCLERFEVGIWSSAREWYMSNALDCVMAGLRSKLLFAWEQNECTNSGFSTVEKKDKPIFLKELDKIWENKYSNLPSRVGQYLSSNSLLIDTDAYKALLNPPHTSVFPTEYKASDADYDALGPKGELRLYLDGLVDADDVPSYIKEHPFGQQPAITALHPDWDYYSKFVTHIKKATLLSDEW